MVIERRLHLELIVAYPTNTLSVSLTWQKIRHIFVLKTVKYGGMLIAKLDNMTNPFLLGG